MPGRELVHVETSRSLHIAFCGQEYEVDPSHSPSGFEPDGEFEPDGRFEPDPALIYSQLAAHQREEVWSLQKEIALLQEWSVRFIVQFGLGIVALALRVEKLPKKTLGTHRSGHNGQGLLNEITLSIEHVMSPHLWDVLGTLLHELLHAWQAAHGKAGPERKGEHNAEFIAKARECGLIVEKDGTQGYLPDSPFVELLREMGVDVPEFHGKPILPQREEKPGKSKHVRYECPCGQAANCAAKGGFEATCRRCGKDFVPVERRKKKASKLAEACELVPVHVA